MKVSELIAKLRLADPDAPVSVYRGDRPEPFVAIIIKQEKREDPLNQARSREKFTDSGIYPSENAHDYAVVVSRSGRYNFLTPEMQLLSDKWFEDVRNFDDYGAARVAIGFGANKLWNIIKKDGTKLLPRLARYISPFSCISAATQNDEGEYVYIGNDGNAIITKSTLEPNLFGIPFAYVDYGDEDHYIDCNGNVIDQFF